MIAVCCLLLTFFPQSLQQNLPPVLVHPSPLNETACLQLSYTAKREVAENAILDYPMCGCGSAQGWTRIAHLDMSDQNEQCPDNLNLVNTPIRGCGRASRDVITCDSVTYPVNGRNYSKVCGRILAYQIGLASAFYNHISRAQTTLELAYLDGVSLTHGSPGFRQHIWTFANSDHDNDNGALSSIVCPCSIRGMPPFTPPSFVGNDYFCESGNSGSMRKVGVFFEDTLWDGLGCSGSTCCELNTPPWFCKTLPSHTTNDIELRSCYGEDSPNGNKIITNVDIYIS